MKRKVMQLNAIKYAGYAIALSSFVVLGSCSKKDDSAAAAAVAAQQAPAIAVMTISTGDSESQNTFPCTIKGKTDVAVRPQVSGFITEVCVDEGQQVVKGQVLFRLDQVQFQAALESAQAAVAQAQANVNAAKTSVSTAQLTADTKKSLYEKNIIAQFEYTTAENQLQLAKASLAQAQAALAQAQAGVVNAKKNLSYTVVTAPCDGIVGEIPNRVGSLASPSSTQPLTTVSQNGQVYAYFSLTEKDLLQMTDNGSRSVQAAINAMPDVELRLADGYIYPELGKVSTISGVLDTSTGAASVRALFPNPSGLLRSGATGQIIIPRDRTNVIVIPQKATYELQDRKFVFVVDKDNKVKSVPIEVTANSDGMTYVVNDGLTPGMRIVVEGVGNTVQDGMTIKPIEGGANAGAAK